MRRSTNLNQAVASLRRQKKGNKKPSSTAATPSALCSLALWVSKVPGKPRIEPLRKQVFVEAIAALRSEFVARVDANRVQISIAPGKAQEGGRKESGISWRLRPRCWCSGDKTNTRL